jgi:hypothetical protein
MSLVTGTTLTAGPGRLPRVTPCAAIALPGQEW